jgi:methionyl-tRNA formyltransferase
LEWQGFWCWLLGNVNPCFPLQGLPDFLFYSKFQSQIQRVWLLLKYFDVTITGEVLVRIVFMGTPEFAVPALESLVSDGYEVEVVYTQPDKAAGRGQRLMASPVKLAATNLNLPVVQPASFKEAGAVAQLADFRPEVIVLAAYGQLLPKVVLDIPAHGCINVHPSLLPRHRGASPVAAAILAGDEFTGVSIMLMDQGLDTGPVLAQAQISILPQDTAGSLTAKLSRIGAQLVLDVLPRWLKREIEPQPQDESCATSSGMLSKEDGEIDWHRSAVDIWRRVRAFQPWPGCYTLWQGRQLKILEAAPLPKEQVLEVGRVIALNQGEAAFGVNTGDGILGVLRVQMEGKRIMSAAEFLRGQRQFIGAILPG